jgi:hypothetical protein
MKKIFILCASYAFILSILYVSILGLTSTKIVHAYSVGQACNNTERQCDAGLDCYIPNGLTEGTCQGTMSGTVKIPPNDGTVKVPPNDGTVKVPPNDGSVQGNTSGCSSTQLCNPLLPQYGSLCDVLNGIIVLVTQIGAVIAVLLIIWTGFRFISAQGNSTKLTEAKKAFYAVLLGTAILLGASGIATIVVKTVLTVTNQNNPGICKI